MIDCPSCGTPTAPEHRFCPSCGVALAAGRGAAAPAHGIAEEPARPLAERRLVSVLFLDLVGFTTISEALDPEDVREVQSRYFETARATIAHYGGSLEKFIGDAVMAVWGTPVAHEDDGERAVRSALEVVAAVAGIAIPGQARHLEARGAVATGEAAVTLNVEGEGMVTGDLVNTASRLQGAAAPGSVIVDAATRSVVGEAVGFEPVGEQHLKGKAAPVAAWRVTARGAGRGSYARSGHRGPFVGRAAELRGLRDLLAAVRAERRMRVVSIVGVAGIGKSRLAWELEAADAADAEHGTRWFAGRAPGYGEGIAFAPLTEMVRRAAGIAEDDAAEVARRAIEETLARLVADADERAWIEPRLLVLLQPGPGAETQREELFGAWRRFFEAAAEEAPIVLLFEDLQWADAGLLDFIDYLADWSRHRPIAALTLARPELLDARPTWGAGLPHFTAMHLEPLPDEAIDELLAALAPGLPRAVGDVVRDRADGVPLYAVEMARMLTERGAGADAASIEIPDSLHALLAARIDALPARERSLLLTAAVLGRRFRPEALGAVAGIDRDELRDRLRALLRREFLAMDDDPRSPGRGQLSFVQELVREVAYHTLSRRERRARHLAVAGYLEAVGEPDLAEPMAEHLVAAHAATTLDQEEGELLAARARTALRLAADRAQALHAPQRALSHLEQAIALTAEPADQADLAESAGLAARAAARFGPAEAHLRRAIDLRAEVEDETAAARHRAQLASLLLQAQRSDTALEELEAAWKAISTHADGVATRGMAAVEVPAELARAHLLRSDPARAVEWAERALALAGDPEAPPAARAVAIDARVTLGTARAGQGRTREGMVELQRAIDEASAAGLGSIELRGINNLAWLTVTDDPRATSQMARRGLELAERLGIREMALQLLDIAGIVAIETGDWDWALDALTAAAEDELPSSYRLDFAATRTIIGALRGLPQPAAPIEDLGQLEPDLDPEAVGWVDHARGMAAFLAGDLAGALALARASAARTRGYERAVALSLAARAAAWSGDSEAAGDAERELGVEPATGRAARAALANVRALGASAGADVHRTDEAGEAHEALWSAAATAWHELDLPVREGLCHLDRWRLTRRPEDRQAALALFEPLGAAGLVRLLG